MSEGNSALQLPNVDCQRPLQQSSSFKISNYITLSTYRLVSQETVYFFPWNPKYQRLVFKLVGKYNKLVGNQTAESNRDFFWFYFWFIFLGKQLGASFIVARGNSRPLALSDSHYQRAKKVVSDNPGLVDFAIGPVNSVFNLPDGQVMFYEEFE